MNSVMDNPWAAYVYMKYFGKGGMVEYVYRAQSWEGLRQSEATFHLGSGAR